MDSGPIMTIFSFLFGLTLGSFLNVCIHRIPHKKSIIHPPSSCPQCGKRIRFYDNIPLISYIILRGKCRFCHQPIPIRYPVVELLTALLSTALFVRHGPSPQYFLFLSFCASLVIISFIDLRHKIIPDIISLPGILVGLAAISIFKLNGISWKDSLIGIIVGGGSLLLIGLIFEWLRGKEGLGMGDVKLLAMIGAWTGYLALPYIVLISSLTGILIGGGSLLLTRRRFSEKIPYGPFLVLGTLVYLFFGTELKHLWSNYLNLSNRVLS
ncbi:MAG: prepilin peptidase [Deltaproteobacteria bacterium]|nr:MAG: prepilin peptidase [Deltaproteobacteria bacterium]